ncbi:MAG: nucleoside-diphosphate kinase [Bacteroidales bacterium]|jgi:nucleoside-diphosphate kinase|nr:nucleoside-diphosphate kinase [Bacteroidales bacterium]
MSGNKTFSMIKPGAVRNKHIGHILSKIEEAGYTIAAIKTFKMTLDMAAEFYAVHKDKPFYQELISFMSSGPIVAMVLLKENAVEDFRTLIGATDPDKAEEGTIRKLFATSKTANAIHGSDSDENAERESSFFFSRQEYLRTDRVQ